MAFAHVLKAVHFAYVTKRNDDFHSPFLLSLVSPPINTRKKNQQTIRAGLFYHKIEIRKTHITKMGGNDLKNRVAEFRKERGLSQEELAEKAGVSRPYISQIETQRQQVISNTVMFRIAEALGVSYELIFLP